MPITIGSNINSLFALRQLGSQTRELLATTERLSSGLRITSAKDDPAGLALSSLLSTDVKIARQGVRNVNDVISVLNVAQSAIDSLVQIVSRQQELATQAANGAYTTAQRTALDTEADALTAEYNRIVQTTSFNGFNLFDGSLGPITVQAGKSNFTVGELNVNLTTSSSAASTGDGTFAAVMTLPTGSQPQSLTSADVNGDGKLDLISADSGSNRLSVFLGNGNGTFQAATTLATGTSPGSVISADVNGDGKRDLISADSSSNQLSVFLGNGDGTFQAASTLTTGTGPVSVISTDVNGDGKIDLVSTDTSSNQLSVFLGTGNGTFQAATTLATGTGPRSVNAADVNGDGKIDLISADITSNRLSIFLGNGNGTFQAPTTLITGSTPLSVTSADLNGDGKVDLISADLNSNRLSIFLGNGDGTFQAVTTLTTGVGPISVTSGDLNGDLKVDLISADTNTGQLSVFLGNGNGTFQAATTLATGTNTRSVNAADLNGDGVLDLFAADYGSNRLSIFIQNATTSGGSSTLPFLQSALDLTTESNSTVAVTYLSQVFEILLSARSAVGSVLSRLDVTLSNLTSTASLLEQADSRIIDADFAEDTANLIRLQVKQQTTTAILAQANLNSQLVLKLLGISS